MKNRDIEYYTITNMIPDTPIKNLNAMIKARNDFCDMDRD